MTRLLAAVLLALGFGLGLAGCVSTTTGGTPRAEVDPADAEKRARVRLELAGLYLGRGQAETALGEVERAIAAKPDMPEAYNLRGLIYGAMGELSLAEQAFQRALQLAPISGDVMHNYGWFLCQQRRWPDAEAQFNAALALPQYRDNMRTLLAQGVCQARAGRWAEAERTLSRSYELDPANPVTAYNLSEVLMRRGELERARFYIARINSQPELSSAQSLWLAVRIERRLGNVQAVQDFGRKLQERYPESNEVLLYERGRFDD
ncbi:MAG: type IV pilus biogenesis/stability protein PilW [Rubrivivax sp.]|nr:type IV pilus biogenesis/stability protein PilW [Rubrivivax sp.]